MLDAHQLLWTQIAAGVCLLIFGGLLFNLLRLRGQMQAARKWNRVEGIIAASEVKQPSSHVSDDLNDASPVILEFGPDEWPPPSSGRVEPCRVGGEPTSGRRPSIQATGRALRKRRGRASSERCTIRRGQPAIGATWR